MPAHVFAALVGGGYKFFDKIVLFDFVFLAQTYYFASVVVLGFVVHLVVHVGLFGFEHAFREAHRVEKLGHRQFGDLLQRVEDVHHLDVLLGNAVEVVHVGVAFVGRLVMISLFDLELTA